MIYRPMHEPFPAGKTVVISPSSFFLPAPCWSALMPQAVPTDDAPFSSSIAVVWTSCNKGVTHIQGAYFVTAAW